MSIMPPISVQTSSGLMEYGPVPLRGPNVLSSASSGFEDGSVGIWTPYGGTQTIANSTAQAAAGTHSLAITCTTAGNVGIISGQFPVIAGVPYTLSFWTFAPTTARSPYGAIQWFDRTGTLISQSTFLPTNIPNIVGAWQQWVCSYNVSNQTAPPNAVTALCIIQIQALALNEVQYVDQIYCGPGLGV